MAIKVFGDKVVFPDNTEQTTAAENIWTDNGATVQFDGDGSPTTQVWAENNGKKASMTQKSNGLTYFLGEGGTFFGTEADEVVKIITNGTAQLALSSISINAFQPLTAPEFIGDGAKITNIDAELNNLAPEAPTDGDTYARNNKTWVSIAGSSGIPDAPVDGLMYGRKNGEWDTVADAGDIYTKTETNTLLDEKADKSTTYTKSEVDTSQGLQDTAIQANTDAIAALPAPVDTYTKTEIDSQQELQDNAIDANTTDIATNTTDISTNAGNIATNTADIATNASSIGTLSVQVNNNSQDIEALQEGIFFSSSYSADYPATANRDPETGNMYMQATGVFTFSYATCNQIFLSKTDEQGNTRQFTAIQPGDSLVLNEVESPNYGRYELVSVDDAGDYVVLLVNNKDAQGSLLAGAKVAFQAFPASGVEVDAYTKAESDAINDAQDVNISANTTAIADTYTKSEIDTWQGDQDTQISENRVDIATKVGEAPEDGKQYGRQGATWTEVVDSGLDIDALPALPTAVEDTDLFVTERTGTNYKVSADELKG